MQDTNVKNSEVKEYHNPFENPNAISLVKQSDGNWMGYAQRFGKVVEVREVKPEDCLLKLITHG